MKRFSHFNKALLLLLIFSGIFLSFQPAHAFLDVIPSLASMQLDALDFIDKIVATLFYVLMLALGSAVFITFSAGFLDWASNIPVGLADNSLVNAGWGFLAGFVNIIFILIFVVIALSYILKLETFGMKKALPRLIIIAFLLNFSLLFVKMFVDLGWIVQNSFKLAFFQGGNLAVPIASQVATVLGQVVGKYVLSFFVPYFVIALIPFANVARLIFFATWIVGGEAFFGTFSQAIMLVAFGLIGGLIFFTYALLFLFRIAVIWLLAIAAPLAFAAYILPQTQKYFSQWLKTLFQWVFLGVVVFFLMGLGLKLFAAVAPATDFTARSFHFTAYYSRFIFLIVYLIVCLMAAKKFTPTAANAIWGLGGLAVGGGSAYLATRARRLTMKGRVWERERAAQRATGPARGKWARLEAQSLAGTIGDRDKERLETWRTRRTQGGQIAEAEAKRLKTGLMVEKKEEILKRAPKEPEDRRNYLQAELLKEDKKGPLRDRTKIAAIMDLSQKDGKIGSAEEKFVGEAVRNGVNGDKILERRPDLAQKVFEVTDPAKIKTLKDQGISPEEIQRRLIKEAIDKIAPEDFRKRIQIEAAKNAYVVEQILRDQTKLIDLGRNAKLEIKRAICETIIKNPKLFEQSPLREQFNRMTASPRWPFGLKTTSKSAPTSPPRPERISTPRPERTPRPRRK